MITRADTFFVDGCGRCDLFATDACKARKWKEQLVALRTIAQQSGLKEEVKWGQPTYTLGGKNVAMIVAFKDYCGMSFFKGLLLDDADRILQKAGPNIHAERVVKCTSLQEVLDMEAQLTALLKQAVAVEKSGKVVPKAQRKDDVPEVVAEKIELDPEFKKSWNALTPGRQRSYVLHINSAKQESTQRNRLEKALPKIFAGKGNNEY